LVYRSPAEKQKYKQLENSFLDAWQTGVLIIAPGDLIGRSPTEETRQVANETLNLSRGADFALLPSPFRLEEI
jgi:hypothetical protein